MIELRGKEEDAIRCVDRIAKLDHDRRRVLFEIFVIVGQFADSDFAKIDRLRGEPPEFLEESTVDGVPAQTADQDANGDWFRIQVLAPF